jgi:hypothetical protein
MSSLVISPFAAALPTSAQLFQYDADGDAIMTDAVTGLPITYSGQVRTRSPSLDGETEDDRPSKRSRSSSGDTLVASPFAGLSPIRVPSVERDMSESHTPGAPVAAAIPPAPKKAAAPAAPVDDEDGDGADTAVRNLAHQMAEAVLDGEPRDASAPVFIYGRMDDPRNSAVDTGVVPPGGDSADGDEGWCVSVTCSDLALRLDMRHPRVVLNLLRFVATYNELAPEGELINLPLMTREAVDQIFNHASLVNPPPEFASEIAELRGLVQQFSCGCYDCEDGYSSDRSYDPYRRDSF